MPINLQMQGVKMYKFVFTRTGNFGHGYKTILIYIGI